MENEIRDKRQIQLSKNTESPSIYFQMFLVYNREFRVGWCYKVILCRALCNK